MNNRNPLKWAGLGISLLAALGLVGCANPTADQETLTIYSGRSEELIAPLLEKFTEETGIQLEVRYGDSAELAAQLLEEGQNPRADIFFSQDAGALGALSAEGLLQPIEEASLSLVPAEYRSAAGDWIGVSGRGRVFSYDPEKVSAAELPTSVLDLMDEKWQGRIAIAPTNGSFQAFVTALRVLKGDDVARDFLVAMKRNAVLYEKNDQIIAAIEAGQVDAGLLNHYYWFEYAAEIGELNMRSKFGWFAAGDPGNLVNVAGLGIVRASASANSLVSWLLGETAQGYFVETTKEYSLTGLPAAAGLVPLSEIESPDIDLNQLSSLRETLALIQEAGLI